MVLFPMALFAANDGDLAALVFLLIGLVLFGATFAPFAWNWLQQYKRLRRDVVQGRVTTVESDLRWEGHHYHVQNREGMPKALPRASRLLDHFLPGRYSFYFLPSSGHLVAVDYLTDTKTALNLLRKTLATAHRFRTSEVDDNRAGTMSPRQQQRLTLIGGLWTVVGVVSSIAGLWVALQPIPTDMASMKWTALILAFGVGAFGLWVALRLLADAKDGKVHRLVCGLEHFQSGSQFHVVAVAKGQRIAVPVRTFCAMPAINYALYFTPHSKRLLSLEPLMDPEIGRD